MRHQSAMDGAFPAGASGVIWLHTEDRDRQREKEREPVWRRERGWRKERERERVVARR